MVPSRPDGQDENVTWYVGNPQYNRHSIGIEIEDYVNNTIRPDSLYDKLPKLVIWLDYNYSSISLKHIDGMAPSNPLEGPRVIGHS